MFSLLVAIIYIAFVSLGLPDSLLGSAWTVIREQLQVPVSYAGIVTMIIAGCTILSSLATNFLLKKMGTGVLTAISVSLTAVALCLFSLCDSFWQMCVIAIPYGLGAGAVDAALNNYAALHLSGRSMNWLHCFWGVGASISPYIMGGCLTGNLGWQWGYRIVGFVQIALCVFLFATLPIWRKATPKLTPTFGEENPKQTGSIGGALKTKGILQVLILFFAYCSLETTAGLWASSYLVMHRGVDANTASFFGSAFYLGMTIGRFVCGLFADKFGDKKLIRMGICVVIVGVVAVMLPLSTNVVALGGLLLIGVGCAPIYPAIIHSTPYNFGVQNSQAIVSLQMACAYVGSTFMPPVFGAIAQNNVAFYPYFLALFAVSMIVLSEWLNKVVSKQKHATNGI